MHIKTDTLSATDLVEALQENGYRFDCLARYPISVIETMAASKDGSFRGACAVGCLACCADAIHPRDANVHPVLLSRRLFQAFLDFVRALASKGIDILSTGRLNLFSASNELDHPDAVTFRRMLSAYIEHRYGVSLGYFSSDIVFHVSRTRAFLRNLNAVIPEATLWDSVCVAIDEQIPFHSKSDYAHYLDTFREVWKVLTPALRAELPHAKLAREGQPRAVLNLLIPGADSVFRSRYRRLFPGGPDRATTYDELLTRYVSPFVGSLHELVHTRPDGHQYTTGIATLSAVQNSLLYISAGSYAQLGRAEGLINFKGRIHYKPAVIKTKLVPVGENKIQIHAGYASGIAAEDEIIARPAEWFAAINETTIDFAPTLHTAQD